MWKLEITKGIIIKEVVLSIIAELLISFSFQPCVKIGTKHRENEGENQEEQKWNLDSVWAGKETRNP